jgi:hypothetical protein
MIATYTLIDTVNATTLYRGASLKEALEARKDAVNENAVSLHHSAHEFDDDSALTKISLLDNRLQFFMTEEQLTLLINSNSDEPATNPITEYRTVAFEGDVVLYEGPSVKKAISKAQYFANNTSDVSYLVYRGDYDLLDCVNVANGPRMFEWLGTKMVTLVAFTSEELDEIMSDRVAGFTADELTEDEVAFIKQYKEPVDLEQARAHAKVVSDELKAKALLTFTEKDGQKIWYLTEEGVRWCEDSKKRHSKLVPDDQDESDKFFASLSASA